MPVKIDSVLKNSIFHKAGIKIGDTLVSVNKNEIFDVLDYRFYCDTDRLLFHFLNDEGKNTYVLTKKLVMDDLGFSTYLMSKHQSCKNRCIFCFVDQMPKGLRKSLYFKDDDSRLSFLFGNYITLTGISEREVQRIIDMHISPINVSVHTMNPDLRVMMMGNRFAGEALNILKRFADASIVLNTQLVLCPGVNDGDELRYSLEELSKLYPAVQSIALIPVGVTKFRKNLYDIKPYTKEQAREVILIADEFNEHFSYFNKRNLAYVADEFYLKAEMPIPEAKYYDDYFQLENGVGMSRLFKDEFLEAISLISDKDKPKLEKTYIITGEAAYSLIKSLVNNFEKIFPDADIEIYKVKNSFFGETVTVAGLLTAKDILNQCKGKINGGRILIPKIMLKSKEEQVFLDDITLKDLEKEFLAKIIPIPNDGFVFLEHLMGKGE